MPIVGLYNRKNSIVHAKETFHSHASSYRNVTTDAKSLDNEAYYVQGG